MEATIDSIELSRQMIGSGRLFHHQMASTASVRCSASAATAGGLVKNLKESEPRAISPSILLSVLHVIDHLSDLMIYLRNVTLVYRSLKNSSAMNYLVFIVSSYLIHAY